MIASFLYIHPLDKIYFSSVICSLGSADDWKLLLSIYRGLHKTRRRLFILHRHGGVSKIGRRYGRSV